MTVEMDHIRRFLSQHAPFDLLPAPAVEALTSAVHEIELEDGAELYPIGTELEHLSLIAKGSIDLFSPEGEVLEQRVVGESVGTRPIVRNTLTQKRAVASEPTTLMQVPVAIFNHVIAAHPQFAAFYNRFGGLGDSARADVDATSQALGASSLAEVMTPDPAVIPPTATAREAAMAMRDHGISCLLVEDQHRLVGMLTTSDLSSRVLAAGETGDIPVERIMTPDPMTLSPNALLSDALLVMSERKIGHLPVVENGKTVGILTRTNLVRRQSVSAVYMISDIGKLQDIGDLADIVAQLPQLLAQLVGAGVAPARVGHTITSVADALTKRLLTLGEAEFGPPPVPYLWLACGSQGRREQTGVSDQDNCLIIDDAYDEAQHRPYFEKLARFVSDGLDACGYYYCPGEMMATNPKWLQPARVWRQYFFGWIAKPDPMAQMLSSVMFDLRPISGDESLFADLQRQTVEQARKNSIFRAHLISNSLHHRPPLGLLRGFAVIRSGEHKNMVDLKHNGIVPIVDLARVYALDAALTEVNTRERLVAAMAAGSLSESGGNDLVDAYDVIGRVRLEHQAKQIRAGQKPDNFMAPSSLSALERNHLKEAFGVIKSLQSALGHARAAG